MCFSVSASFTAGAMLTVIGAVTVQKRQNPAQLLFASIPLIFGVQQLAEGILWLALPNPDYLTIQKIFTHIFVFFAQVLWPIWVPIAFLLLEKKSDRKNIQKVFVGTGVIVGLLMAYSLLNYHVEAKIIGHHIAYFQDYPNSLKMYGIVLYILSTIVPPFFSTLKYTSLLGCAILLSYVVTAFFYQHYILSVWCFFSSIISILIYVIMKNNSQGHNVIASNF